MKPFIICVDDQQEVLNALVRDLEPLAGYFEIECCESADEVLELMESLDAKGEVVGLVISDHRMPEKTGLSLLTTLHTDARFNKTKKIMLTGQASHEDTIKAINNAKIDAYISKPWTQEGLNATVINVLTHFLFDQGLYCSEYLAICDQDVVLARLHQS